MKAIAAHLKKKRRFSFLVARMKSASKPIAMATALGAGLFILYAGAQKLMAHNYFRVKEIRWIGLRHLKESEMSRQFHWAVGRNLFKLESHPIQQQLLSNPWVKEAVVRKEFPDGLSFILMERTPAAVEYPKAGGDDISLGEAVLLDEEGRALERGGDYPSELPRIINMNRQAFPKALQLASLFTKRSPYLIDLSHPKDLVVHQAGWVIHFGDQDYSERWRRFLEIEMDLEQRGISDKEIDLRFPGKVIVKSGSVPAQKMWKENHGSIRF